ncbi:hypothetical protein [Magnetospirillum gryphiswaldense]|uniref:Uncharacterized protein n=1 Tax=Magnetospirillum gryphiswaldense TaxID=55518 RepID=A4U236_9PROT|nr:hypothetical protein [Magnetospirillum gryphiswaldense]AVM74880.1 hypothetical protein MSR1_23980 [Magnetospirillum gryphiswaldense MSR-1]AVM78783.1 hypothetical protein MSR1L_23980 [Magnetospirillum gryphiswaldense]CAM76943.1 hypothetical protein MGR_2696 [Magnetospirillum gryphiswaldense MSR-1]
MGHNFKDACRLAEIGEEVHDALIRSAMVGAVTDWEDDKVLVIDNPDGFAGWDGHKNQYCRSLELAERFVEFFKDVKGKWAPHQRRNLQPARPPVWVAGENESDF